MLAQPQHLHQQRLGAMGHLGAAPHRQPLLAGIEARQHTARLHRMAATLVEPELPADAMSGTGEGGIDLAVHHARMRHLVVRAIQSRSLSPGFQGSTQIGHHRQALQLRLDQARCILGHPPAVGDHQGNRFTDIADLVLRQPRRIDMEADHCRGCGLRNACLAHHRAQIGMRQHRLHTRQGKCRSTVHAQQPGMRQRTAHEHGMQAVCGWQVVDKTPLAAQQRGILHPRHATRAAVAGDGVQRVLACSCAAIQSADCGR